MRVVRKDGIKCLSIARAAWLTAHNSEGGAAASGATAMTAGAADGKAKSTRRENERGRDKKGLGSASGGPRKHPSKRSLGGAPFRERWTRSPGHQRGS